MYELINKTLLPFESTIGNQFLPYRNHVHRLANLTSILHPRQDDDIQMKIAIASAFHDIGIWTAITFDYLNPSVEEANNYLIKQGLQEWIEEIGLMIQMHHKMTTYHGKHENIVNAFRKADLIDISGGLIRFGLSKEIVLENYRQFPMLGFQKTLVRLFLNNLKKNPLKPLPMFKR